MYFLRKSEARGKVDLGWLKSNHSFSFGHYYDPKHMGFSVLRVINDDIVKPSRGFERHGHKDMEIISYVVEGALEHKDSEGNEYIIPQGDIQVMSAGSGIFHSEFNASKSDDVNFLQIWITPNKTGVTPAYKQQTTPNQKGFVALVSPDGQNNTLQINQDAWIYQLTLDSAEAFSLGKSIRKGYLHIVNGRADVVVDNDTLSLNPGDAVGVYEDTAVEIKAGPDFKALWFDLPV